MKNTNTFRPGGLSLTQRTLSEISLTGKKIIDIGCGSGATVDWLRAQGSEAYGIDYSIQAEESHFLRQAEATALPFADQSIDIALMECSLSIFDQPQQSLCECHRVLKFDGHFIMSDLFARDQAIVCHGILGQIRRWEAILAMTQKAGFCLKSFREEEHAVRSYFAQLLFESPEDGFKSLGTNHESLKRANSSYFVAVFGA